MTIVSENMDHSERITKTFFRINEIPVQQIQIYLMNNKYLTGSNVFIYSGIWFNYKTLLIPEIIHCITIINYIKYFHLLYIFCIS